MDNLPLPYMGVADDAIGDTGSVTASSLPVCVMP